MGNIGWVIFRKGKERKGKERKGKEGGFFFLYLSDSLFYFFYKSQSGKCRFVSSFSPFSIFYAYSPLLHPHPRKLNLYVISLGGWVFVLDVNNRKVRGRGCYGRGIC